MLSAQTGLYVNRRGLGEVLIGGFMSGCMIYMFTGNMLSFGTSLCKKLFIMCMGAWEEVLI